MEPGLAPVHKDTSRLTGGYKNGPKPPLIPNRAGRPSVEPHLPCQEPGGPREVEPEPQFYGSCQELFGRGCELGVTEVGRSESPQPRKQKSAVAPGPEHRAAASSTDLFLLNASRLYQQVIGLVKRHPLLGQEQRGMQVSHRW